MLHSDANRESATSDAIVVSYSDVHDRRWETRLQLSKLIDETGNPDQPGEMCLCLEGGAQHTVGPFEREGME